MSTNLSLESFINSIKNLYQQGGTNVNYAEIDNTLHSNPDAFISENPLNLIDNILPIFPLPVYTLPNIYVLQAATNKIQYINKTNPNQFPNPSAQVPSSNAEVETGAASHNFLSLSIAGVNVDRLLNLIENSIQFADEKQVKRNFFLKKPFLLSNKKLQLCFKLELAVEVYSEICHFYTNRLCQLNKPKRGLPILQTAITKIQFDLNLSTIRVNQLTTVHSDLLQLSLAAKNFRPALDLLSHDILDINKPNNAAFDSRYLLGYFYYAGCVYAALKQFDSALFYFEQALTVPGTALSQIMIESYKKLVIISLISKGKVQVLPKYTSRIVTSQIKSTCYNYSELAQAFMSFDQEKLNDICSKLNEVLVRDNNIGLVKQLKQALYKKNIQKLTKTFITLSLNDMATKVKLGSASEAERLMLSMIRDGEIFATINQKDGKLISLSVM